MIESFNCRETEKIFRREFSKMIAHGIQKKSKAKLDMLNAATDLLDLMSPPGNRLEKLKGIRKDEFSIRINDQWRICFKWINSNAMNVKIEDYH